MRPVCKYSQVTVVRPGLNAGSRGMVGYFVNTDTPQDS
jgi:hypothetical protein